MFEKSQRALWSEKDPRSVRSRQALHEAILKLLEAKPFEEITVRDIAATAGVGYTTFFRHYSSKEELLHEAAAKELRHVLAFSRLHAEPGDTRAACRAICDYVEEHRPLWKTLLGGSAASLKAELLRVSERTAAVRGSSTDWLPADIGVILSVSGLMEVLAWWLRQPDPLPAEKVAEILDRVIIGPITRGDYK